jgi:hypothetical protein
MEPALLDELLLHVASLASIYHKSPSTFLNNYKPRYLMPSPVLRRTRTATFEASVASPTDHQEQEQKEAAAANRYIAARRIQCDSIARH